MTAAGTGAFGFTGEVVIVTGAAMGIGAGIAQVLAEAGATVVIADRVLDTARATAAALVAAGHAASAVHIDMADEASITRAVADVVARHGTLWGLVNNAGIQDRQLLLDGTAEEWDRVNAVNSRGVFLASREAARAMVAGGAGGRIVHVASAALIGSLVKGHAVYAASKAALVGLMRASALELAEHAITVNMVLPGGVATPGAIHAQGPTPDGPARRRPPLGMCEPRDIGAAVLYFASPMARCVTNQSFAVDGGWSVT
ncbi:SDR family oxidoreductase [Sphingobium sufflavum]|uniref:SDR family NAD(P)-dependent oxidoreductase n=1 Tax=Sphingobium sufflavum TaxID=1129547 RepID=UPI001F1902E6|nr:SDR family NAD(P)-dependent oxidoreductase [Sphingobium sufflavum]MCE7795279.1 SDR family oxidoreductase [Sphingobium sufflavum]